MKKRYRISPELKPYLRRVMARTYTPFLITKDKNGQWWCETNTSSDRFHMLVQRAKCEKRSKEDGTLYVTFKESQNAAFMALFLEQNNSSCYQIIDDRKNK